MIGKIYASVFPYYDTTRGKKSFKKRPVFILSGPRNNDYTVLPVSSISNKANFDYDYDIEIDPHEYPLLNLSKISYIRTHKQTTVHRGELIEELGDVKTDYEDLYLMILEKLDAYNKEVMASALQNIRQ